MSIKITAVQPLTAIRERPARASLGAGIGPFSRLCRSVSGHSVTGSNDLGKDRSGAAPWSAQPAWPSQGSLSRIRFPPPRPKEA
jgi:hypothetical protein